MKNFLIGSIVLVLMIILTKPVEAQDHGFGLGIVLGEPTGLSAKLSDFEKLTLLISVLV